MSRRPKSPPRSGRDPVPAARPDAVPLARRAIQIEDAQAGQTLAAVLRAEYGGLPWSRARELCRRGKVRVGGQRETDDARRLRAGDRVEVDPTARRHDRSRLPDDAVLYLDRHVIVVNKPAGVMTVPFEPSDEDTLDERVRTWLRRRGDGRGAELGVVQRLDKDTTGVIVFARTLAAKRHLQQLLRAHDVERRYLALVHGDFAGARTADSYLLRDRGDGLRGSYGHFRRPRGPIPRDAQRAITHLRPLERLRGATLIECRLETGRQHQIRIHASELGHPLLGEAVYIRGHHAPTIAAPRPMLHAAVLGFAHPADGRLVRFEQPLPGDFADMLQMLRG